MSLLARWHERREDAVLGVRRGKDLAVTAPNLDDARGRIVGLAEPDGAMFLERLLGIWDVGACALLLDHTMPVEAQIAVCRSLGAGALGDRRLGGTARIENAAVIKLTSGSSGAARGIAVSAEALLADTEALHATMGVKDGDRIACGVPWSHSYGFSLLPMSLLARPCTLVTEAPTIVPTAPAYLRTAIKRPDVWPDGVRTVISAGAPLAPATARAFRERFGLSVHVFYGASESGGICYDRTGGAAERGTVGTPIEGVDVRLGAGDIVEVRSAAVAAGYVPEADAKLARGCFTTDDVGAWRDGELVLLGRVSDLINVDGRKVSPREVERVIAALAGVAEVVVSGQDAPDTGKRIVRAVIAGDRAALDYNRVQAWCRERLAPYKVPRSVVFVDEIPRNPRGKPDRDALDLLA